MNGKTSPLAVLLIDDSTTNLAILQSIVKEIPGTNSIALTSAAPALEFMRARRFDLVVVDYFMPGINGIEFIAAARKLAGYETVHFVMVTTIDQLYVRNAALEAGAMDFLTKPFDFTELKIRLRNLLSLQLAQRALAERAECLASEVREAVSEIAAREREVIMRLSRAAEFRDTDTGDHLHRVAAITKIIAADLGMTADQCELLALASTMHDVGKIAVSDTILFKQGPLSDEERALIMTHAASGYDILDGSLSPLIQLAAEIAISHHERWDGAGYPANLAGTDIPLSGRIVSVADVFDALTTERPYKKPWPIEKARDYIAENRGKQFDPRCVEAFLREFELIAQVARRADSHPEIRIAS